MTFSITGWCDRTGHLGFAMATFDVFFGPPAPHSRVEPGLGSVTCQAMTRPGFADKVIERLAAGVTASEGLSTALDGEAARELFQVCVVDSRGRAAAFTGERPLEWRGHLVGEHCAAAGNILSGAQVVEAMVPVFERGAGSPLPERLLAALEAGYAAGGDRRGARTASLWVAGADMPLRGMFLRVQEHAEPIQEVRRLLALAREETDFQGTVQQAWDLLQPVVDDEALVARLGGFTTLAAVEQLAKELATDPRAPQEALRLLDRIAWQLREVRPDMGAFPFAEVVAVLRARFQPPPAAG